ncbi:hypothetical protein NA78x_003664 [Anatilimnocola sp. NA78]|uniref:hypothetical protein n=1 Tax=Anatilimnocola sp. NA78 TaxID=3415683 RepID=UPI003CE4F367
MAKRKSLKSLKLLFIGNSFTQRNNLPELLAQLASARNLRIEHSLISAGGASLRTHWNAGTAAKTIEAGGFDYVILQEQSTLPVKNATRMAENIRLFAEVIQRAGAQTVLYMTWARQHSPETQQAITAAYESIGEELAARVIPVGRVWQRFLAEHSTPLLYDRDQSHPTLAGSYLAACVFLTTLFVEDPCGIEIGLDGLSQPDLATLQAAAQRYSAL